MKEGPVEGRKGVVGVVSVREGSRLVGALEVSFPSREVRLLDGEESLGDVALLVVDGEGGGLLGEALARGVRVVAFNPAFRVPRGVEVVRSLKELVEVVGVLLGEPALSLYKEALVRLDDALVIADGQGRILFVNPSFSALTGYTMEEVRGRTPRFLAGGGWPPGFYRRMWTSLQEGIPWRGVVRGKTKEGRLYHQEMSLVPVRDSRGRMIYILALLRDVTGEKALEERLFRLQKEKSVSRLVRGVAHEFCNMLTGILGYTQLLLTDKRRDHPDYQKLSLIESQTLRAAEVARNLLSLGQEEIPERRNLSVRDEMLELKRLLEHLLPERIEVVWEVEERLPALMADPLLLRQIILNLVINARDAMPRGGRLEVRVYRERVRLGVPGGHVHGDPLPGDYVVFSVSDTGEGIPGEEFSRVFEPFYTTRPREKGSGLGLAAVSRMVRAHGGFVVLESQVGRGSVFRVYLPLLEEAPRREERPLPPQECSVMVVEDEDLVRKVLVDALMLHGYRVMDASNGEEALERLRRERVDLLITDLVMPKMGGEELVARARELYPEMKVIIVSGYSSSERDPGVRSRIGEHLFLYKPFGVWEILKVVEESLTSKEGGRDAHL